MSTLRRSRRRRWVTTLWRWSVLVTLPVSLAFLWWVGTTWQRHAAFRVQQATLEGFRLHDVGAMTAGELLRRIEIDWATIGSHRPLPGLRTLDLFVPEVGLARLDADLPHSGFEYVDGVLRAGNDDWRVEVRYRGDNVYHWGYRKKSFRVKTKKSRLFEGLRSFNLIAPRTPELLNNYLAYRLAHRLGLLAPRVELVELRLNGKVMGVHVLTEQLDESTLRGQGYMPGDLFSGDAVAQRAHAGIDNDLFRYAGLWEKQAENNHYPLGTLAPLQALLAVVRASASDGRQRRLRQLLDVDSFAAFSALEILCATIHVDTEHNWRLFYDANRCRFVPVVWDLFGWDPGNEPEPGHGPRLDVLSSPLHVVLHEDGGFLAARQRVLAGFFGAGEDDAFLAAADAAIAAVAPAVWRDPALTMQVRSFRPRTVVAAMGTLRAAIADLWRRIEDHYTRPREPVRYWRGARGIGLAVADRVPVTRVRVLLRGPSVPGRGTVRFERGGTWHEVDVSAGVRGSGSAVDVDVTLCARHVLQIASMQTFEVRLNRAVVRPAVYELALEGIAPADVLDVRCERGGGEIVSAVEVAPQRGDLGPVYCAVTPRPIDEPRTWRGDVELAGVTELDVPLIIEPGTRVRLAPGASLVLRGRLLARGTEQAPIRFEPAGDGPWGVVALQGQGANGSLLRHCELRDGSGYKTPMFEYSAMLSVHDVAGVVLEHCRLHDSRVVDDMFHAVYADLRFVDCSFTGALFDAVDLDISRATFERCRFVRSGNDGLDLMTSSALVSDCTFEGCGDKGISVGEGSRLLALQPRMVGCVFGVQVKDDSIAAVVGGDLRGNRGAVDAYKKNWRYGGGGRAFVYDSTLAGNGTAATADLDSRIVLRGCVVDPPAAASPRIEIEGWAAGGAVRRVPEELEALRDLEAWRRDR